MLEYQIEALLKTIAQRAFGDEIEVFWGADTEIELIASSLRYALREAFECGRSVK